MIKIIGLGEYELDDRLIKMSSSKDVLVLVLFVVVLGVASAYVLGCSFNVRDKSLNSSLEGYFGSTLYTDKNLYRVSESVSGGVELANTGVGEIVLENVQYIITVYSLGGEMDSNVFIESGVEKFANVTVHPHNIYNFKIKHLWDQRDVNGNQVPEGKYLIEVQLPTYNATLSKIIYIK